MPMNMSYCRFTNTLAALRECNEALQDMNRPENELSEEEVASFRRLVKLCRLISDSYEEIK